MVNLSNIPEFASALTVAIEKIADPDSAALAIYEISAFRERRGRFGQRVAHISAEKMSPSKLQCLQILSRTFLQFATR